MKYSISISAFCSALFFIFGAGEEGILQAILFLAGGVLAANAFHEETKIRKE